MALTSGGNAPYAPPAAVIEVITRYRERGMTTPFTTDVLERAGVAETLSRRTMQALKLLGIIDAEGNPTPEFEGATRAGDGEYKERLGEVILEAYSEVLKFADPASDSYDRVRDAFRPFNPRGQQERMVTLFLGLLDFLGMETGAAAASRKRAEPTAPKPNGGRPAAKRSAAGSKPPKPDPKNKDDHTWESRGEQQTGDLPPALVGLLRQIPRGGSGWPAARRQEFMAAFQAVLDFTVPVREHEPAPQPADAEPEVTAS